MSGNMMRTGGYVWLVWESDTELGTSCLRGVASSEEMAESWIKALKTENKILDHKTRIISQEEREIDHLFGVSVMKLLKPEEMDVM